jgi:hypothetical protein
MHHSLMNAAAAALSRGCAVPHRSATAPHSSVRVCRRPRRGTHEPTRQGRPRNRPPRVGWAVSSQSFGASQREWAPTVPQCVQRRPDRQQPLRVRRENGLPCVPRALSVAVVGRGVCAVSQGSEGRGGGRVVAPAGIGSTWMGDSAAGGDLRATAA